MSSVENQLLRAWWFFGLDLEGKAHISSLQNVDVSECKRARLGFHAEWRATLLFSFQFLNRFLLKTIYLTFWFSIWSKVLFMIAIIFSY